MVPRTGQPSFSLVLSSLEQKVVLSWDLVLAGFCKLLAPGSWGLRHHWVRDGAMTSLQSSPSLDNLMSLQLKLHSRQVSLCLNSHCVSLYLDIYRTLKKQL